MIRHSLAILLSMESVTSASFLSRTDYASKGLGARLYSFKPKDRDSERVFVIEKSIEGKLRQLTSRAEKGFHPDVRSGKVKTAVAAAVPWTSPRAAATRASTSTPATLPPFTTPTSLSSPGGGLECNLFFSHGGVLQARRRLHVEDAMQLSV